MAVAAEQEMKAKAQEMRAKLIEAEAQVPLAELYKYSTTLRSMTQGRGMFESSFSHYEEAPHEFAQKIIEESPSPVVNERLRKRMGRTAVEAAKARINETFWPGFLVFVSCRFLMGEDYNLHIV